MAGDYDEVRLVFDIYINSSLKEQMRRKRTKGKSTHYHAELTTYLAAKTIDHSKGPTYKLKKFIVSTGTETKGNTSVPPTLVTHSQEEADTFNSCCMPFQLTNMQRLSL